MFVYATVIVLPVYILSFAASGVIKNDISAITTFDADIRCE